MTTTNRFVPTHTINMNGRLIEVMARPGDERHTVLLYTREEWRAESRVDWTATHGLLQFQGSVNNVPPGTNWMAAAPQGGPKYAVGFSVPVDAERRIHDESVRLSTGRRTLKQVVSACVELGVGATLRDEAGFVRGHVKADGRYSLT